YEHDGRTEIAGIADEAGRVANSTGGGGEHLQVIFRRQVRQASHPTLGNLVAELANRLADVVGPGVDVGPQDERLQANLAQGREQRIYLRALATVLGRGRVKDDEQEGLAHVEDDAAAAAVHHLGRQRAIQGPREIARGAAYAEDGV